MAVNFVLKLKYDVSDLLEIMKILRSPEGCPWDREQTHESIKKSLIEETYEVVEAINKNDKELMTEELGDVLLQVVFHSQIGAENGEFDFSDVCDGICKKLIERHPHVFGDISVKDSGEVLENWEQIKSRTKHRKTQTDKMLSVPRELPALMRSAKIQEKASKVGFDWEDVSGAFQKLSEESDELKAAVQNNDRENMTEELGDIRWMRVLNKHNEQVRSCVLDHGGQGELHVALGERHRLLLEGLLLRHRRRRGEQQQTRPVRQSRHHVHGYPSNLAELWP